MNPSVLSAEQAKLQHDWLRGARARLLRIGGIARRSAVLELGAGRGLASVELANRCGHQVTAIDNDPTQVDTVNALSDDVRAVNADAHHLPFADATFDLIFSQFAFLWFDDAVRVLAEAIRVLQPGGAFVAIEPDYPALIEYPMDLGLQSLWVNALQETSACPHIGRRLAWLATQQFPSCDVLLPERLLPVATESLSFLATIVKSASHRKQFEQIQRRLANERTVVHLPLLMLHCQRSAT